MKKKISVGIQKSLQALKKDKHFSGPIKKYGVPDLAPGKNYFKSLVSSIVYQQLSGKAAGTIFARFVTLFPKGKFPTPAEVLAVPIPKLRSVGLSGQKVAYIQDLARKFSDGTIDQKKIHRWTNQEIIDHLVQVKGIGVWTAHMFLIFTLNRPDIFPVGDLGIRKGMQVVYGLRTLPSPRTMERLGKPWREHATAAAWYLWRVADDTK